MTDPAIMQLREALAPFAEVAAWAERNGHDLAGFDMLLRYIEGEKTGHFAGHLGAQSDDFIKALEVMRATGGMPDD